MSNKQLQVTAPQLGLPQTERFSLPLVLVLSLDLRLVGQTWVPGRGPTSRTHLRNGGGYCHPHGSSAGEQNADVAVRESRYGAGRRVHRKCHMKRRVTMVETSEGSGCPCCCCCCVDTRSSLCSFSADGLIIIHSVLLRNALLVRG